MNPSDDKADRFKEGTSKKAVFLGDERPSLGISKDDTSNERRETIVRMSQDAHIAP